MKLTTLVLLLAGLCYLAACQTATAPPGPTGDRTATIQEGVPGGVFVNTVEVSVKVTAIDTTKRKLTLLLPDGQTATVKAGPEVVNFDQIQKGDLVMATLTEELVVYLAEEGTTAPEGAAAMVALAPKGAKPGALLAEAVQVIATVAAIDPSRRTATLRFENVSTKTFPVRDDIDLSRRKPGEKVVFLVTEMIAIFVENP